MNPSVARLISVIIACMVSAAHADPAIEISDTARISANTVGVFSPTQAGLPESLWADQKDAAAWKNRIEALQTPIASKTLRNVLARALSTAAELPESDADLLLPRVEALIAQGQGGAAKALLDAAPEKLLTPKAQEYRVLFSVLAEAKPKPVCLAAQNALKKKARAFWQRWVVLCQAKKGEAEKAQLGLDLLSEQSQSSEFFAKLVTGLTEKTPPQSLPKIISLEQAAWLVFAGQPQFLQEKKNIAPALQTLLEAKGELPSLAGVAEYSPDPALLDLPETPSAKQYRRAFLAYTLTKALGQKMPLGAEKTLKMRQYRAEQSVLSPVWLRSLKKAATAGDSGEVVLLLAEAIHAPLSDYTPYDIASIVRALRKADLKPEAAALAKEAIEGE